MPRAPRQCAGPGCENRITGATRYCADHTTHHWTNGGASRTSTPEHRTWAANVLRRHPRCQIKGPRCTGKASIADHIVPDAEGGKLTPSNGQGVCATCHKTKTAAEATAGLRRAYGHTS